MRVSPKGRDKPRPGDPLSAMRRSLARRMAAIFPNGAFERSREPRRRRGARVEGAELLRRLSSMFPGKFERPARGESGDWFVASRGAAPDGACDVTVSLFLSDLVVGMGSAMHAHFDQDDLGPARAMIQRILDGKVGALVAYKEDGSWSWASGVERGEDISEQMRALAPGERVELHFYAGQEPALSQIGA